MTDGYEIIRSRFSDQYNPIEYNGRYALLVAPVREDIEIQFKYDITQMRYYLIANGWCDCDIIFLTCTSGSGREELDDSIGSLYNGNWIDGEAYHDNLKDSDGAKNTAFWALQNGGYFELQQDTGNWEGDYFSKLTKKDIVFIEFRDHGYNFKTYAEGDYSEGNEDNFWTPSATDNELDLINYRYLIFELDFCYSGNWISTVNGDNRAIITSASNELTGRYDYLYYGRIRGYI